MQGYLLAALYSLDGFFGNIRVVDFFDVLIIALFLYIIIILFKRTHSWPILAGIGILVIIYSIAKILNLYLTSLVLQSFFAVFIVVLVIIFNQEVRRFFEFISFWNTRQFRLKQETSLFPFDIQEVLQAVANLTKQKRGALIVFPGNENIDRFLDGGKRVDGVISEELLESLFDPHSIGHDGAVIINKNRIARFGAHLPLSSNFKLIGRRGTRHSAALGISEHTDALAISVSEERGTISIAHNGKLKELGGIEELESSLKKFYKDIMPGSVGSLWGDIVKHHSYSKLLAIGSALIIWFFFSFQAETVQRSFSLPIVYRNLPERLFIEESEPREVMVTFVSRGQLAFERIDERLIGIAVDSKNFSEGRNIIVLSEDMIIHPSNFAVVEVVPSQITVQVKKFNSFNVSVKADTRGGIDSGYRISSIAITPDQVGILIPDGTLAPESIITQPIDIAGLKETKTFSSHLVLPANMRFRDSVSPTVTVRVNIVKR
ncbi:MAG: diadenylate cyclase [bacterium]|nr:diadenylate cyclase [bacterium]